MSNIGTEEHPLQVAIVGSGPSGFYACEALLKSDICVNINMLERLPVPYGLVRSGVAPDHPKLKQAIKVYARIAESPRFKLLANVKVGLDLSVAELTESHHAVIFANGAETDRKLGVPGEDIPGSHTATEFVGWYNGHPDYRDKVFDLKSETAVIIGQGNVAADVARILAKSVDELKHTDIAEHALDTLAESNIKDIYVVGRRGPAQVKFTPKELREFESLELCQTIIDSEEMLLNPESAMELEDKSNSAQRKIYEQLSKLAALEHSNKPRNCHFTFLKSPKELLGSGHLEKVVFEHNQLSGDALQQSARGTGETLELETGLLFRSIGYRGIAMPSLPFDEQRGLIPNMDGRISENQQALPGLYVTGWIKRGPTGIIGTNRADSVATVQSLLEDLQTLDTGTEKSGADGVCNLLQTRNVRYVSFEEWEKIDQSEIDRGQPKNKPREKYTYINEMLDLLG
ncbi:MAG: NADP oxidoreductase [Gammaproteobacteria bacterium]|jgi:ferredoxin/flavodoxin---NADP+ reductase|nr:NADP oxidoreductase [Gammaproteobacteria bacterium]